MPKHIVETAKISLRPGTSEQTLLAAFTKFKDDFLLHQPGFLKIELLRQNDRQFLDLVHWQSREHAARAFGRSAESEVCHAYFELMEIDETDPEGGVTLYDPIAACEAVDRAA